MASKAMTLDDLECQNKDFLWIVLQFVIVTHISRANFAEIARDRLGQSAYKTFSIKRSFH